MTNIGRETVEATTIDRFCAEAGVPRIDILKLDVQGGELRALAGGNDLLTDEAVSLIYTETMVAPVYQGQGGLFEIGEFLGDRGYRLFGLYDLRHGRNGVLVQADAIFVSSTIESMLPQRF